jgi:serine/threonine protein kinase
MYSLGIILFELMYPLITGMERAKKITSLRNGVLPEELLVAYPKEAALILWMTAFNPEHRPSASELLELDIFASRNKTEPSPTVSSTDTGLENKQLKLENETLKEEVRLLKARVKELEALVL